MDYLVRHYHRDGYVSQSITSTAAGAIWKAWRLRRVYDDITEMEVAVTLGAAT